MSAFQDYIAGQMPAVTEADKTRLNEGFGVWPERVQCANGVYDCSITKAKPLADKNTIYTRMILPPL